MFEEVILKKVAEDSYTISEIYKNKVWNANDDAIKKMLSKELDELLIDPDFINFSKDTQEFFSRSRNTLILFDTKGRKILVSSQKPDIYIDRHTSSIFYNRILIGLDKFFLSNYISKQPLASAFRGKSQHSLVSRAIILDRNTQETKEMSYINSYFPIIENNNNSYKILGVIQITTDITDLWDKIVLLEKRIFISFVVVFLVFFVIVMYNTNYAQKIINKQFETNRDLEKAKIRAESESSAKTEFLANISHELRTPLNAIIGFSEIMISETYGKLQNKNYQDYVSDINNSGKHLLSVINDILDFSKASADRLSVENVELDLNKLASSSMRFVKPRADEAGVHLVERFPHEHIIIKADPKRLKQALLNLLSNAVKFTPPDGSVTLSIKKDEVNESVMISVIDTGIGMSDQDIPKALSSFGQVDNKLSRRYEGTGLGLPLTKKLIELMEGKFDLQSRIGKGTKVLIEFKYSDSVDI